MSKRNKILIGLAVLALIIWWQWDNIMSLFTRVGDGSIERNVNPCQKSAIYNIGGQQYQCCGQDANGNNVYYPVSTGGCSGPATGAIKNKNTY